MAHERSSDEDGTVVGDGSVRLDTSQTLQDPTRLTVQTAHDGADPLASLLSPSQTREQAHRLDDDLAMLQAEQQVSQMDQEREAAAQNNKNIRRSRSRREDLVDEFEAATNPTHEKTAIYRPPENPSTKASKFLKRVHESSFLIRYFTYIVPIVAILLIPLLLGALVFPDASVGGVRLLWFSVWLEIVWLTLWAGRVSLVIVLDGFYPHGSFRFLPNAYLGRSVSLPASSPTTAKNGGTWPSSWKCLPQSSSGGSG